MQNNEDYFSVTPKSELLKKHISYYYFHTSSDPDFQKEYVYYPHFKNAITVYKKAEVFFENNNSLREVSKDEKFDVFYSRKYKEPTKVKIRGEFQKLGIVFQPLGLNAFLCEPLSKISVTPIIRFSYFEEEFNSCLEKVFDTGTIAEKVEILDDFFERKWIGFANLKLEVALKSLFDSEGTVSIAELSQNLEVHPKTLYRLFKKHLCCSIQEYRGLIRFRSALNLYQSKQKKPKLIDLAYESQYYDQAEFINHFKSITGHNPKKFFSDVSRLGKQDTFWTILK